MIETTHIRAPQGLWRWESRGSAWAGRKKFNCITPSEPLIIQGNVISTTTATFEREDLDDAAKIFWMMGYNAKGQEAQDLFRKIASEFSHFKHLLPVEFQMIPKKSKWTRPMCVVAIVFAILLATPLSLWLMSAAIIGARVLLGGGQ